MRTWGISFDLPLPHLMLLPGPMRALQEGTSLAMFGVASRTEDGKMARPDIPNLRTWPRNLSTSHGGGLSTSQYGGMSTSQYGGMSTSQYGGKSTSQYGGLSTSQYGGLSTSQYGGLSTSQYGGLSSSEGGGMSTSSSHVYRSNIPP